MGGYWERVTACGRDIRLFLVFGLFSYLGIGIFALIFNLYLVRLGYNEAFIGAYNAVYTLSMGATCLAMGYLINRFGNWTCIALGTVEFVISAVLLGLVSNAELILVLAALNGIGSAFITSAQMTFIIEWTPRDHLPAVAALSSAINSGSVMIGSLVG